MRFVVGTLLLMAGGTILGGLILAYVADSIGPALAGFAGAMVLLIITLCGREALS